MKKDKYFDNISFLPEDAQTEIKTLFVASATTFITDFKLLFIKKNDQLLRKICHNFASSLIVFNLDECVTILQKISTELKLNNFENAYVLFLNLELKVNAFIENIKQ